jgi:murein DD-endopeptidase MepM/ murein hydrolase activator NlpD
MLKKGILWGIKIQGLPVSYKRQVMYDYNLHTTHAPKRLRPPLLRRVLSLTAVLATIAGIAIGAFNFIAADGTPNSTAQTTLPIALDLGGIETRSESGAVSTPSMRIPYEPKTLASSLTAAHDPKTKAWKKVIVAPGDNFSLIFGRHGYSKKDLHKILETGEAGKHLRRLNPGQLVLVKSEPGGHILGLVQELDYRRSLHIEFVDNAYSAVIIEIEPEIRFGRVLAKINRSLFLDGQAAGLADKTIMGLTDIFGWDVDFVLDVRSGDQFSVVFEEIFKNGKKIKNGKILAAEFVNQGNKLRAIYYSNQDGHAGYYSDEGQAMQKAFLRAPVNFTRISSGFNLKRRHPVLNKIRAHKGVDYAAPHGTPIRATANGKVIHAGNKGGYGRTVVIKHGEAYSTLFAHMSRFARGIKSGLKVKQGQTIGYVGKTGLATGPHLHYEFRVNGVHRNPLKIAFPKALPIDAKYIADFRSKAAPLLAQLDELGDSSKAENFVAEVDQSMVRNAHARSATR